mgnify:CR=1 FL=1
MFKFLRSLVIWQVMRNNMPIVKRCLIAIAIFLASLYFFPDWESYFEMKNSLNMLLYTKLTKYAVLIYAFTSFISNAKKLSILGKKEKEISTKEDVQENSDSPEEDLDPDLEIIRDKQKLKSRSDRISEKYKKDS